MFKSFNYHNVVMEDSPHIYRSRSRAELINPNSDHLSDEFWQTPATTSNMWRILTKRQQSAQGHNKQTCQHR